MSTDEYSQELPDELFIHRTPSAASSSYPNIGSSSSCSLPMPGNMDMTMQMAHLQQPQDQEQRQKRKYTRRKQPEERKKRGPRTKDLNAPRMPLNGYVRFLNANRERIKQENPDLSFAEVTKKLASEWSSMSSEEKKAYLDEAEKAKEMYLKELHEYQQTESYQEFLNMKQRTKQQQQPMTSPMVPQSQSPMQIQPSPMYSTNQQYFNESGPPPQPMHPNQYSPMYPQSYPYGMNGAGKFAMSNTSGGPNAVYAQQQYYPSPGHSSVASDYGNLSGSSQFQARFNSPFANPTNGMSTNFTASSANSIDLNDPMSLQGNSQSGSNSLSAALDKCNSVMDLPIFTEEFLEHNKMREQELRHFRGLTMQYEEENAILSKHVDDMTSATEKQIQDEIKERETNGRLKAVLEKLQHSLVDNLQDVDLPQFYIPPSDQFHQTNSESQYCRPSMDNIDYFMAGLDQFRAHSLINGGEVSQATFKSEPLVQSIHSAISALDEVTF